MKKNAPLTRKAKKLFRDSRGATIVEYGLLLICMVVLAAASFKALKGKVTTAADNAGNELN